MRRIYIKPTTVIYPVEMSDVIAGSGEDVHNAKTAPTWPDKDDKGNVNTFVFE